MKNNLAVLTILMFIFVSCHREGIRITTDSLYNPKWNTTISSGFYISMMKVKNGRSVEIEKYHRDPNVREMLEIDSLNSWYANAAIIAPDSEVFKTKTISFLKFNGFYWYNEITDEEKKIFGKLVKSTWYMFSGLSPNPRNILIYVDNELTLTRIDIPPSNW